MKTAYLIKSPATYTHFDCHPENGLTFVTSVQDITFLENVVVNGNIKIFVRQKIFENSVSKPTVWFLVFDDKPLSNSNLEEVWNYAIRIGSALHQFTQLGQVFSYKNLWVFPNIPDEWKISETLIQFNEKGGFDGIYWDDPSKPMYELDGELVRDSTLKTVNADLVLVVTKDNLLTQAHFVHVSLPANINIDTGPLAQDKTILEKMKGAAFKIVDRRKLFLLELYNRAITSEDIYLSATVLFQMVEAVINVAKPTFISNDQLIELRKVIVADPMLLPLTDRLVGAIKKVKMETSKELLKLGLEEIIGKNNAAIIDHSDYSKWGTLRSSLTHTTKTKALTEPELVSTYKSLRRFCADLVQQMYQEG